MKEKYNIFVMIHFNDVMINNTFYSKIGHSCGWWIKSTSKTAKLISKKEKIIDIPADFLVLIEQSSNLSKIK
jgi:hypothetical protein